MFFRLICLSILVQANIGWTADSCEFDADDADSPGFVDKILRCEKNREQRRGKSGDQPPAGEPVRINYGEQWIEGASPGASEKMVVVPGPDGHRAGQNYEARELYSLRSNAKFEESITLAIHKLHAQMARFCSRGWEIIREWSVEKKNSAGMYYLHYHFRCSEQQTSTQE